MSVDPAAVEPEDAKLITLARGARARVGADAGAAIRDETGRTYSGATVVLTSLSLSALSLAVAQAAASGSRGVEAAVVVGSEPTEADLASVRDVGGAGVPVLVCAPDGSVRMRLTT
jgi:hypothetical protein